MSHNKKIIRENYQIEKILGIGGYGITYLAIDLHLPSHPQVVVKQLNPQNNDDKTIQLVKERFKKEAKVLEQLGKKHNQIPKLYASFEEHQEFYIVEEFIDGYDLRQEIIPGKQMNESKVFALLQEILQVLEFVHQQNVIHRDLKPSNLIRRRSDSKIVIIDFGAVKEIEFLENGAVDQPYITCRIGTPGYMPVEQEQGKPNLSSDIYAVGLIGIQALTGLKVYNLEKNNSGEIIWRKYAPDVSDALANILDRMVRSDCQLRYQFATEALKALENLNGLTTTLTIQSRMGDTTIPPIEDKTTLNGIGKKQRQNILPFKLKQNSKLTQIIKLFFCLILVYFGMQSVKFIESVITSAKYNKSQAQINMNDVCQQDLVYKDALEVQNGISIDKIVKIGPEYKKELDDVWPVFRWVCLYKVKEKNQSRFIRISPEKDVVKKGIDLDAYCNYKYPNDKIKASHHNYNDPNSLFCVRPRTLKYL